MKFSNICGIIVAGAFLHATPAAALVADRSLFAGDTGFKLSSDKPASTGRSLFRGGVERALKGFGTSSLYVSPKLRAQNLGVQASPRIHRDVFVSEREAASEKASEPKVVEERSDPAPSSFEVQTNVTQGGWFSAEMNIKSDVPLSIVVNTAVEGATHLYSVKIRPEKIAVEESASSDAPNQNEPEAITAVPLPFGGALLGVALLGLGVSARRPT